MSWLRLRQSGRQFVLPFRQDNQFKIFTEEQTWDVKLLALQPLYPHYHLVGSYHCQLFFFVCHPLLAL